MSTTLGSVKSHIFSHGDLQGRCPGCYKENVSKIGVLTVDGTPRDISKCENCNRLFESLDGSIKSLAEEASHIYNTSNIGFTVKTNGTGTSINPFNTNNINITSTPNDYKLSNMDSNLTNINNNISNLIIEIYKIMKQNQDLINKLATDPLINIRKNVSDFNLV